jgi:hypothetical protein
MGIPAKWLASGKQVILKGDFIDLWNAILQVVTDVASSATPTPAVGSSGAPIQYNLNALNVAAVLAVPTGTPVDGQLLTLRILDAGDAKGLTFASGAGGYAARGAALPTTTVISKYLYVWFIYNAQAARWDCVDVKYEA